MKLVHWPLMGGLLHLVQEELTGRSRSLSRPLIAIPNVTATRGGAADFMAWGAERAKKFFLYPPLFQMWGYKQANISRGLLNTLKFVVWLSH